MRWIARTAAVAAGTLLLALSTASARPAREDPRGIWRPAPATTWQWQLTGRIDRTVRAEVFDVDLFETPASVVRSLHGRGRRVICYLSAGSYESWRPDAGAFPRSLLGRPLDGWPGERWLDIRRLDVLAPIMRARLDACRARGFDGVEPDNVDGYRNPTGFPLRARHQLRFNRFLAREAHARGLSVGLKNDLDQVAALEPAFDWALNEECFAYRECERLRPFIRAGKAVFTVEYDLPRRAFCARARALRLSSMRKRAALGAWRAAC